MGEIVDMMLEGDLCEGCGVYLGDGEGFPQYCHHCEPLTPKQAKEGYCTSRNGLIKIYRPSKVNCPKCNKLVKKGQGLKDHMRVVHKEESYGKA